MPMISRKSLILVLSLSLLGFGFTELRSVYFVTPVAMNDKEAISFCKNTPDSYVAIVWPLGMKHADYVIDTLNTYASVKYAKKLKLKKNGPFLLYRYLHQKLTTDKAKEYFKAYKTDSMTGSVQVMAIAFETDQPLETIVAWKKEIRKTIGIGHPSIHINDYYPQTIEAAELVFNDHLINKWLNRLPADSKLLAKLTKPIV